MSTIPTVHKVECSEGYRSTNYEQTHTLMLLCSDGSKKAVTKDSKFSYCLSTQMNPTCCKYALQRRQGQYIGFQFLILALTSNKDLVCFISTGKIFQILGPN